MSESRTTAVTEPATAANVSDAASPERPTRVVFADGELLIDGKPVCPVCHEDAGSPFCGCTSADLLVGLDVASLRELRRIGLAAA